MITVRRVTNIEQDGNMQLVSLSGDLSNYLTVDYMKFETGQLVFEIPAGMNIPEYIVRIGNLKSDQVIKQENNRYITHEDVLVNIRSLFPVDPYSPYKVNGKKQTVQFAMDKTHSNGVSYSDLLDSFSVDDETDLVEDDFSLDISDAFKYDSNNVGQFLLNTKEFPTTEEIIDFIVSSDQAKEHVLNSLDDNTDVLTDLYQEPLDDSED